MITMNDEWSSEKINIATTQWFGVTFVLTVEEVSDEPFWISTEIVVIFSENTCVYTVDIYVVYVQSKADPAALNGDWTKRTKCFRSAGSFQTRYQLC